MKSKTQTGVAALILVSLVFAAMGLFIRYLAIDFTILQQVYLRILAAFIISLIVFNKQLHFSKLKIISISEWGLLLFRAIAWYGFGVSLLSLAILHTKLSNATFIGALPLTAIFGIILFREKVSLLKIVLLIAACFGVLLIGITNFSNIFSWQFGDLLALISSIFFSLAYITRRYHSSVLSNKEMTVILFFLAFVSVFITSLFVDHSVPSLQRTWPLFGAIVVAGAFNVANIFLINFGFEYVAAVLASNILTLESVFAIILGFLFFREVPTLKECIGGALIVASVIAMNSIEIIKKKQ